MLWIATELYYGEYKREHFGFSSALTGAMSLVWVSLVALRIFLFSGESVIFSPDVFILFLFVAYGVIMVLISFTHTVSEAFLYKIAAPSLLYFCSFVAIFIGEKGIAVDRFILLALIIFFVVVRGVLFLLQRYFLGFRGDVERVREARAKNI